jgi:photosystem II stability/assembly factor-like uncharacterized protein
MLLAVAAWGGLFTMADPTFAQTWTQTSAPANYWSCVASSADGTKLVAAIEDGYHGINNIYTSTNSGATWLLTSAPTNYYWASVASSADGNKLAVMASNSRNNGGGAIFVSTNSGTTWMLTSAPTNYFWDSVASSADGTKLVAVSADDYNSGKIYTSTNGGATWTQQTNAPNNWWFSVVSSADGTKLVVQAPNSIYRSTNSGVTWMQITPPPISWEGGSSSQVIASSADGTRLVAAFNSTFGLVCPIFISTNSGATWAATSAPSNNWTCVASSADGTKLVAVAVPSSGNIGPIYTSTNSGATWTSNTVPNQEWTFVACSADGNKMVAVSGRYILGLIYTLCSTPAPSMNIMPSRGDLTLSWLVPSTNFVMQQSSDLGSWTDVSNSPALNLTNLQDEVTLPMPAGSGFYRLKTP